MNTFTKKSLPLQHHVNGPLFTLDICATDCTSLTLIFVVALCELYLRNVYDITNADDQCE